MKPAGTAGANSLAAMTLPRLQFRLSLSGIRPACLGVFAQEPVSAGAVLGPLVAPLTDLWAVSNNGQCPLPLVTPAGVKFFELTDEKHCNWLMHLQSAFASVSRPSSVRRHNLLAYQNGASLYFRCIRPVAVGEELSYAFNRWLARLLLLEVRQLKATKQTISLRTSVKALTEARAQQLLCRAKRRTSRSNGIAAASAPAEKPQRQRQRPLKSGKFSSVSAPVSRVSADTLHQLRQRLLQRTANSATTPSEASAAAASAVSAARCSLIRWRRCSTGRSPDGDLQQLQSIRRLRSRRRLRLSPAEFCRRLQLALLDLRLEAACRRCRLVLPHPALLRFHQCAGCGPSDDADCAARIDCPVCCAVFEGGIRDLSRHINSAHSVAKPRVLTPPVGCHFGCAACGQAFARQADLLSHAAERHGVRVDPAGPVFHTCPLCEYDDKPTTGCLRNHLKSHCQGLGQLTCPLCGHRCRSRRLLARHQYSAHRDPLTGEFPCPICQRRAASLAQAKRHHRNCHSGGSGSNTQQLQLACDGCGRQFAKRSRLRDHLTASSLCGGGFFGACQPQPACSGCGRRFSRRDKLTAHIRLGRCKGGAVGDVNGCRAAGRPKKPKCVPQVPSTDFERFIYKCRDCSLGFKRRGVLVNHMVRVHPDIPLSSVSELNLPLLQQVRSRPHTLPCPVCDCLFRSEQQRHSHLQRAHGIDFRASRPLPQSLPAPTRDSATSSATAVASLVAADGLVPSAAGQPAAVSSVISMAHCCPHCPRQYAKKEKLTWHMRRAHPALAPPTRAQIRAALASGLPHPQQQQQQQQQQQPCHINDDSEDLLTQALHEFTGSGGADQQQQQQQDVAPSVQFLLVSTSSLPVLYTSASAAAAAAAADASAIVDELTAASQHTAAAAPDDADWLEGAIQDAGRRPSAAASSSRSS